MADEDLRQRLRAATEDDVAAAIRGSYVEDRLAPIKPVDLLEFFNLMLNERIGEEED